MEKIQALLNIDPNYIIIGLLVVLYTMEQILNRPFRFDKRLKHLLNNIFFFVVFVIANYFFAIFQVYCITWLNTNQVGLLHLVQLPFWVKLIAGVALFDMTSYWFHRMAHKIPLLWRLHRVHHSDTSMDSSTFFRSHPIEILVFGNAAILAVAIFGMDMLTFGLYIFIFTPFAFLEHTNLTFPKWLDKTAGLIFVTPNFHKVHHEQDQYYTDSNFSDIFIIWDRLFGTVKYKPVTEMKYGLAEFEEKKKQSFLYLMKSPFINITRVSPEELHATKKKSEIN
jgi:sterol desaturase/sphingolipid hydroxylase (fatty acid hydroxylase superfamily)